MKPILIMLTIGAGVVYAWHVIHTRQQQKKSISELVNEASQVTYFGAPAWPTMAPLIVPELALPKDVRQLPTYYGVDATLLEQDIANA